MKYAGYELTDVQALYVERALKSSQYVGESTLKITGLILFLVVMGLGWTTLFDGPPLLGNLILFHYGFTYTVGILAMWWLFRLVSSTRFQGLIVDKTLFNYLNYRTVGNNTFIKFKAVLDFITVCILAMTGWWPIAAAVGLFAILSVFWRAKLIAMVRWRLDEIQSHYSTPPRLFKL